MRRDLRVTCRAWDDRISHCGSRPAKEIFRKVGCAGACTEGDRQGKRALSPPARSDCGEIDLAYSGGVLEPRLGERLQLARLDLNDLGNAAGRSRLLRAGAARLKQPMREARQLGAERLRQAETQLRRDLRCRGAGIVGLVGVGVAARGARCGSGLLRARGELRPAAGEASSAGRAAFCAGLRRGFAAAGEGKSTDLASEADATCGFSRSAAARLTAGARRAFLAGLELATVVGSSPPPAATGSAFAIGVSEVPALSPSQLPWWSGGAPEGVPWRCLFFSPI